jgi:signal transduction histidine kinase
VPKLNERFQRIVSNLMAAVSQTGARLLDERVHKRPTDLVALVESIFQKSDLVPHWQMSSKERPFQIDLDAPRFESALLELIHNSRRFAPVLEELHVVVRVGEFTREGRRWARLEFEDNGLGVPENLKSRVFELFFSHNPQGERGMGAGLFFVRRIVEAHGGTIAERGNPPGARFVIDLPRFAGT